MRTNLGNRAISQILIISQISQILMHYSRMSKSCRAGLSGSTLSPTMQANSIYNVQESEEACMPVYMMISAGAVAATAAGEQMLN